MPTQQFGFQLPENARRMLGYIFLMFLCYCSLMSYNRCLLQRFHSPLSISVVHYAIVAATYLRFFWVTRTDKRRNQLPNYWSLYLKRVLPTDYITSGIVTEPLVQVCMFHWLIWSEITWALDIGCSFWSVIYIILLSLNAMTTSSRITFILMFAIAFGLEQWSNISQIFVGIVTLITSGLLLFTFESTESIAEGFALALFTSGLSGLRWTIAQILAQKQESVQQALEEIQQLKDENDRLKLEKCQWKKKESDLLELKESFEKELHDVQQKNYKLVLQKEQLRIDLRAEKSQVDELATFLTTAEQALEEIQEVKDENDRLKLEKCQWKKKESDLLELKESFEKELRDVQQENLELELEKNSLQTDLRAKEAEVHRLETTLATVQRVLEECQQIKKPCDWVVSRDEVQMADKCLGVGGWGKVVLGTFRGCKVAVKEIHELILSPHNRRLFEREMDIASRCRHPCLLQFIGATNDDGIPLFISELLETSLRALLEQRQLEEAEKSIISLDVSLALNYLHNMKPSPIIHRDVSSANVLLWRQGDQWRGKLSDYGTAKFVECIMTRAPGAAIYSAPEAFSSKQTSKVDVFSFGVLLCEMCIRELPDPGRRKEQVRLVRSPALRKLVLECLQTDPAERPDMAQIIQEIETFKGSKICKSSVSFNSRQTVTQKRPVQRRKLSPKYWTANDPEPQMIPDVDRK